jgi:hypothetical protein
VLVLCNLCKIHFEFGLMYKNLVFTGHRDHIHLFAGEPLVFEQTLPDANRNLIVLYEVCLSQRTEPNSVMVLRLSLKL